ncbi:MAG TPA: hypothetical protein VLD62_06040, partial [Acidimicrobiia bacterium]|nr:hypothetical protein [Acidimicrobiia bacterium]
MGESLETDPTAEGFAQSIEIREGDVITVSSEGEADREFVVSGDFVDVEVGSGERITIVHATPSRDSLDFGRMRDGVVVTTRVVDGIAQVVAEDRHGNSVTHSHPGQSQIERFAGGFGVDEMRIFAIPEAGLSVDGRGRGDTFVVEMDGGEDLRGTLRVRDTGFPFSTDRLIVNGTAGDDTVGITDEQVLLGAPVFSTVVFGEGSGLELIRANLRAGDDQAFLYSSLGTLAVEVNGEDGDDVILAGSGPELGRDTRLADLGNGGGIFRDLLSPELIVTLAGTELAPISIDFDLAVTLGDVIDAVEAHDELELDFNETGNGLILRASVPGARVQVARTLAAVQLGLRLDVEETSVTLDENPVEHTLTLAPGDEIEINGEAVTISIGAELILGEGDELSVDGVTLDLHGDTSLLFDQTATDALAEPVQFLRDGPLEFFFIDDGDRLTLNVPPLLTIDDGVSGVASFEFDDGFLYVNAPEGIRVPIRADAVETADALAARIGHALSEGLLDLELVVDAVDPNVLHIGTLADGTPAFSSTSDAIGFSSASSLEGLHIYARGPGGTLNELDGNGFDGPIRLTGGGQEAVTPGDPSHGYDVLVLDDSGDVAANTGILGGTRLTGLGIGEGIHYSGLEIVDLRLGRAEDTLLIESTDPRAVTRVSG